MASVVQHNIGSQLALGELNKNINKVGKLLKKVSSGQKLNSAQDDSASFCISEKMREQIRSLLQADQNVQNASSLLKTAEAGIQQQIDLIRTIREKVIDADNDTNTDEDRKIIQKEIDQFYKQIDQIAYETDYNTQKPLLGNTVKEEIIKYIPYLEKVKHHLMPGDPGISGALNVVEDVYKTLDGLTGPFDQLKDYGIGNTTMKSLGITSALKIEPNGNYYTATPYEQAYITSNSLTSITSWTKAAAPFMNNRGFSVYDSESRTTNYYVLTDNPGVNTYANSVTEIDIRGCTTTAQVMAKIDEALDGVTAHRGNKLTIKKEYTLYGFQEFTSRKASSASAISFGNSGKFSGAVYEQKWYPGSGGSGDAGGTGGYYGKDYDKSKDGKATGSCSISSLKNNTGFTVYNGSGSEVGCVRFVSGPLYSDADTTTAPVGHQKGNDGVTEVSIAYLKSGQGVSFSTGNISVSITSSGSVTLTASPWSTSDATAINKYTVKNGISASSTNSSVRVRPLNFEKQAAEVSIDLSNYQTTNSSTLEAFISDLAGKALKDDSYGSGNLGNKNSFTNSTNGYYYEFIDSASTDLSKNRSKIYQSEVSYNVGVTTLDLNTLRNNVNNGGMKIADAFYQLLKSTGTENLKDDDGEDVLDENGNPKVIARYFPPTYNIDGDDTSGVKSISVKPRTITNNNSTIAPVQGVLRHYDLDFNSWFNENEDLVYYDLVSEYLDGKGLRAFCATDATEWFNFIYRDGEENFSDDTFDTSTKIHTIQIDVSNVKSAADLAKAIYKQGEPELQNINHNFHLKLGSSGVVTIYDIRPLSNYFYAQNSRYANFQTGSPGTYMNGNEVPTTLNSGAKIADGIIEADVERDVWEKVLSYREEPLTKTLVKNLIIQDTNKADLNLRIQIPQMTLSNIFYPLPKDNEPFEYKDNIHNYTVITKENRMLLLGDDWADPPVEGILDRGLNYLLDAAVLVGAQNARLEHTQNNLVTMVENVQASESTIRDADMAKEMTEYTKYNILQQSAQAMLAQANQNGSSVLSLLQ